MDLYGNPSEKGKHSDFLQLLWERGVQIEGEILNKIKAEHTIAAIEGRADQSTFEQTLSLMKGRADWIYQGVLIHEDKIGRPDLLERVDGKSAFGDYYYIPCDIKSGRATKSRESEDIKSHYASQMLFYCDLLQMIQNVRPEIAKIIDIDGAVTEFDIAEYQQEFLDNKELIERIVLGKLEPEPVIGSVCTQCVWTQPCLRWAQARQDPTLLYRVGKLRDELKKRGVHNIEDLSKIDIEDFLTPAKKIKGAARTTVEGWKRRASVWLQKAPIIYKPPAIRKTHLEVYYDIEDDPSIDHVYLHGFIEVRSGKRCDYQCFLAGDRADEKKAANQLWTYLQSLPDDAVVYHYGSYEKTKLAVLMEKHNLSPEIMEKFDRLRCNLYGVLEQCSDWPVTSYGIKSVAKFLGFKWTAEDASGANSIAWYTDYRKDPENRRDLMEKILTYNKEDCEAMIVVKDFLIKNG